MDNSRALRRWLAVLRSTGHLLAGVASADGFQRLIGGFAKNDPIQPYTSVMVPIVLSPPRFFGPLFAFGMLVAGLGLMLGLHTRSPSGAPSG